MKKQHLTKLVALSAMAIAIAAIIWGFAAKKAFAGAPGTYTITYNANGGTINGSSTMQVSFVPSSPVSITSTVPTKSGCNFLGWSTSKSATSATYKKGQGNVRFSGNVTLYAVWQSKGKYTIKFVNGSSSYTQTADVGQKVTLKKCTFSAPDVTKKFGGWATESSYGVIKYTDGATVDSLTSTVGATVTLTAKWAARTYRLEFYEGIHPSLSDLNLADYPELLSRENGKSYVRTLRASKTVSYVGMTVTLESARSYSGYTFVGWGDDPVNPTVVFKADSKADVYTKVKGRTYADVIKLYGIWCPTGYYSCKVDANGGYWSQDYAKTGYSIMYIPKSEAIKLIKQAYGTANNDVNIWGVCAAAVSDNIPKILTSSAESAFIKLFEKYVGKTSLSALTPALGVLGIGVAVLEAHLSLNMSDDMVILKRALQNAGINASESVGLRIILSNGSISSVERWNGSLMYSCRLKVSNNPGYWYGATDEYNKFKQSH